MSYAKEWNESGEELRRKFLLEAEEFKALERQIETLSRSSCTQPGAQK